PGRFFRWAPGREEGRRDAYYITCTDVIKDAATGEIVEVHCTYDPASQGGSAPDGRRVRGTLHWVSEAHSLKAEVRQYSHLFDQADPENDRDGGDFTQHLNPDSLEVLTSCRVEPSLLNAAAGAQYQFERQGYFCVDSVDSSPQHLVFNRTVPLRDSWSRIEQSQGGGNAQPG
ncbi:MAG: glutamine--tRNA ligase, partial [Chloroflexi bacterium]|nr:glutamine--tRNA ligase [Chloroflexota bacterium]